MGYSFRLTAMVLLYASSHRQDSTYYVTPVVEHWLQREIDRTTHRTMSGCSHHGAISRLAIPGGTLRTTTYYLRFTTFLLRLATFYFYILLGFSRFFVICLVVVRNTTIIYVLFLHFISFQ